jgi:hypothetical protein
MTRFIYTNLLNAGEPYEGKELGAGVLSEMN